MILERILEKRKDRYQAIRRDRPLAELRQKAEAQAQGGEKSFPFRQALTGKGRFRFICECKKASPSKGLIAADYHPAQIAADYQAAGADALSVLTEPDFFQGADRDLLAVREAVSIPVLRKDFIFSAYQIYEAKCLGADAVLLIKAMLSAQQVKDYQALAQSLGMDALVECHTAEEIDAVLPAAPKLIGVNNRDLKTFTVDLSNTRRLRDLVPDDVIFIGESGVSRRDQVAELEEARVDALLIGETMMKAPDKAGMLAALRGESGGTDD